MVTNQEIHDLTNLAMQALCDLTDKAVVELNEDLEINKAEWLDEALTELPALRYRFVDEAAEKAGMPLPDSEVANKAVKFAEAFRALNRVRNAVGDALDDEAAEAAGLTNP